MPTDDIQQAISELKKNSELSLSMILVGVVFLAGTVYYSATRLAPLEQEVQAKREEIAQLEARRTELTRLASAAEGAARPAVSSQPETEGWIYLGRVSDGNWAPQSDRVESAKMPADVVAGSTVKTRQNVSLVGDIDSPTVEGPLANQAESKTKYFVKPGTDVKVLALRQQDTIGGGKLLWAKAQVSSADLLQIGL